MRNCRQMTQLISDSLERRLSWSEKLEMWFHTAMCRLCQRFRLDIHHLHQHLLEEAQAAQKSTDPPELEEPAPARDSAFTHKTDDTAQETAERLTTTTEVSMSAAAKDRLRARLRGERPSDPT